MPVHQGLADSGPQPQLPQTARTTRAVFALWGGISGEFRAAGETVFCQSPEMNRVQFRAG